MRQVLTTALLLALASGCSDPGSLSTTTAETTTSASISTTAGPTSAPPTTTTAAATTSATAATTTTATVVPRIKVEDGVKTEGLDTLSVRVGEMVRFEVEADTSVEVHVHGYDLTFETIPGEPVSVEFVADATGIFDVEIEQTALHILDIEVTP